MLKLPFSVQRKRPTKAASRPPFAERFRRLLLIPVYLLIASAALATLFVLGHELQTFVRDSNFFAIENIEVHGATPGLTEEIVAAVESLRTHGDDNLLLFNLDNARFKIRNLPRVREARLRREFPQTLHIEVKERRPLLAANFKDLYWVDEEGVLLGKATPAEIADAGVPILTGLRGSNSYAGMRLDQPRLPDVLMTVSIMLETNPELARQFAEWNLSPRDEVTGILRQGVEVRFGQSAPQEKLAVLETVLRRTPDLQQTTYFDLRFENQVVYF